MKTPDWTHLRAFHAAATAGSLAAAARRIGLTQPTLTRQIQALEATLGLRLFDRAGRRLVLTDAGAALLEPAAAMAEAAEAAATVAGGEGRQIAGRVRLSATEGYAAYVLPRILGRIRAALPGVSVEIHASNALSDLARQEADVAIRHTAPSGPGLAARRLPDTVARFYAAQDWVARHGMPQVVDDLPPGGLIAHEDAGTFTGWLRGIGVAVPEGAIRLASPSSVAVWEMVRAGLGAAAMLREIAAATPGVVPVLPTLPPIPVPVWLVTHDVRRKSPHIRAVADILAEALGRVLRAPA
jgi:DNA-binding transcriptional LysR family regulator